MAASADPTEIIELTDLIEKGPNLPESVAAAPETASRPSDVGKDAGEGAADGADPRSAADTLLPAGGPDGADGDAPADRDVRPRDWETQLEASAATLGDAGLRLSALAQQVAPGGTPGAEGALPREGLERLQRLEAGQQALEQRLRALEQRSGDGRSDGILLMETVERLTHLEEQLQGLDAGHEDGSGDAAPDSGPDSVLLMANMERLAGLEEGQQELAQRLQALEEQAGHSHNDAALLMETAERLTHLEEQVQALLADREKGDAAAPAVPQPAADAEGMARLDEADRALAQRLDAQEQQLADLLTDFDKYVEKAAAAAAARVLHEEIRRLLAEQE